MLDKPGFTYSACGPFTKNKQRIIKFKETRDAKYIYKNELNKACFQHDIAYGEFKDLAKKKQISYEVKDLTLLEIQNMMDIREVLLLLLINFLIKSPLVVVSIIIRLNKICN